MNLTVKGLVLFFLITAFSDGNNLQVVKMASFKGYHKKKQASKLGMVISGLRKENASLKKTLAEMTDQHSKHNKLIERFLCTEATWLESLRQLMTKNEKHPLPPEQGSASDELASTNSVIKLQNLLTDALEKNKQWLEYDQQREAYVRAILARMSWLEKQLDEANQSRSQQHNVDHSDEKVQISETQEHYEKLLQKTKDVLEVHREQVDITHHELIKTQNWCKEIESEVEELKQQFCAEKLSKEGAPEDDHGTEDEEQQVKDEISDLQNRLDQEKRRSANLEIKISSQDLEGERQDSSYLKRQSMRVLKTLKKKIDRVTEQRDKQDHSSCEVAHPQPVSSGDVLTSSPPTSLLNESFLECPSCHAEYPASHYQELINHIEICLD
ncbi:centrosomal protein of 55 kDa isoform X2 [Larimichthys crocea]|uniref:centrosomal protein of 55 kDa isoform X2 n=1 Tax=Larimichthys crocea TaxID=215358 RepID=UPI000F5FFA90|nr:centrosomal protein of 55 kDa isoform X2 [Larimichthys crocea]